MSSIIQTARHMLHHRLPNRRPHSAVVQWMYYLENAIENESPALLQHKVRCVRRELHEEAALTHDPHMLAALELELELVDALLAIPDDPIYAEYAIKSLENKLKVG